MGKYGAMLKVEVISGVQSYGDDDSLPGPRHRTVTSGVCLGSVERAVISAVDEMNLHRDTMQIY